MKSKINERPSSVAYTLRRNQDIEVMVSNFRQALQGSALNYMSPVAAKASAFIAQPNSENLAALVIAASQASVARG